MATELPPVVVATPAPVSTVTTTVKRSWKGRAVVVLNALGAFVTALLAYLQTINLQNFGITADRALFWMAVIGLVQFILLQINPVRVVDTKVEPGPGGQG